MSVPKDVFGEAMDILARRREAARRDAAARREAIARTLPEADRLLREISATGAALAAAVMNGGGAIGDIRAANERAQAQIRALFRAAGLPEDHARIRYACPLCDDTGFVGGHYCGCLKKLLSEGMIRRLGAEKSMRDCSFESFSLAYYPETALGGGTAPAEVMRRILRRCKDWAESFSADSANLLFIGAAGLGKTHLSLSMARRVIDSGFDVAYYPFGTLLTLLEAERFSRGGDYAGGVAPLLGCELLILDDLGSEFPSPFGQSLLYELVNTRLVAGRPTVISTNLTLAELEARYGERLFSRLVGGYETLIFRGKDVRLLKRYGPDAG